jgi:hypothetical protein
MHALNRITTQYSENEDRILLTGEINESSRVMLWVTQRLLNRLMPHLWSWLQAQTTTQPHADLLQGFAQQSARSNLTPQVPVSQSDCKARLVSSVDLKSTPEVLELIFKWPHQQEVVSLTFQATPLRQWLSIAYEQYCLAGWSVDSWPEWVKTEPSQPMLQNHKILH